MRFASLTGFAALTCLIASAAAQAEPVVMEAEDLSVLSGPDWTGELTYRGYEAPFDESSIPVALNTVELVDGGIRFGMLFDDATETANSEALLVTVEGTHLAGAEIVSRTELGDSLIVITREECEDEADDAICERIYRIASTTFSMTKEVILDGGKERYVRNRYDFTRE